MTLSRSLTQLFFALPAAAGVDVGAPSALVVFFASLRRLARKGSEDRYDSAQIALHNAVDLRGRR
jgi:hypothetical protein